MASHVVHEVVEGHPAVLQTLDGQLLDDLAIEQDPQLPLLSIDPDGDGTAPQFLLDIVGLVAQLEAAIPAEFTHIGLAGLLQQPAIGINGIGDRRELRRVGELDQGRLVPAGDRLPSRTGVAPVLAARTVVGSFVIVEVDIGFVQK